MIAPRLGEIFARCEEVGDCMVWQGPMSSEGRPMFYVVHHKLVPVRRLVIEARSDQGLPRGRYACVSCSTYGCVSHAVARTRKQQMDAAVKAGRHGGPRHSAAQARAKRGKARLDYEKVAALKAKRAAGATYAALGIEFGIHLSTAHKVCNGQAWAPIQGSSVFNQRA